MYITVYNQPINMSICLLHCKKQYNSVITITKHCVRLSLSNNISSPTATSRQQYHCYTTQLLSPQVLNNYAKNTSTSIYRRMSTSTLTSRSTTSTGPTQQQITDLLLQQYQPLHLDVINESYMHSVPANSETHFKVIIVSDKFIGQSIVERHRSVNNTLSSYIQPGKIHALSITAKTVEQWNKNNNVEASPNCMGGSKHDKQFKQQR